MTCKKRLRGRLTQEINEKESESVPGDSITTVFQCPFVRPFQLTTNSTENVNTVEALAR